MFTRHRLFLNSQAIFLSLIAGIYAYAEEAWADDIFDVEHARAAERSGWPLSETNLWYLDRWGGITQPSSRHLWGQGLEKDLNNPSTPHTHARKRIKGNK